MNEYEIRKYHPELKNQILEVQKHHWGSDMRLNAAYLKWKYDRNPYGNSASIYVAMRNGQVIGMLGMYGGKWEFGEEGKTMLAPCPADVVVDPEHRGRGLFKRMMAAQLKDLADQGLQYSVTLSAGSLSSPALLQMGWRTIGPVGTVSRVVSSFSEKIVSGFLSTAAREIRGALGSLRGSEVAYAHFDSETVKRQGDISPFVTVQKDPRPEAMAELVARIGSNGRIRHVRDEKYFVWRFQNPFSRYRFLFWQDRALEGYLVLQTSHYKPRHSASVVDWEGTSRKVKLDLLQSANLLASRINLLMWSATVESEERNLLGEAGFHPIERSETNLDCPVLIRPVSEKIDDNDWF
ncbi:MAG TPA: GNAT family N-acetyltransferase, partial [Acidobacteriota bacterium]